MLKVLAKFGAWWGATRQRPGRTLAALRRDPNPQRYLDPAALQRLTLTPMLVKRVVEGYIHGLHKSPFHGFSVEFADHRQYVPGDDLKYVDWPVYARTDHYYIRRYEQETNVRTHMLLDCSASMAYGTGSITKWDYACFLCSCLGYLMLKQHDAAGLALVGSAPGAMLPPRCRGSQLRRMMSLMMRSTPSGTTNLPRALAALARRLPRRSLIVIVSDLIDDPEPTLRAIRMLGSRRHDIIVFHLMDEAEARFDFEGPTMFQDMETGQQMQIDPSAVRQQYLQHLEATREKFQRGLREVGIDYEPLITSTPYDRGLSAYLRRRQRLGS